MFRNGDSHHPGVEVVVTKRKYRTMDSLLDEVSSKFEPTCVLRLYNLDSGEYVQGLEGLVHGSSYVCLGNERLKKVDYRTIQAKKWSTKPARMSAGLRLPAIPGARKPPATQQPPVTERGVERGNVVTVFRNGVPTDRGIKLVVNGRVSRSLDNVLDTLSASLHVPGGVVRALYHDGRRVTSLDELYSGKEFVALGTERFVPRTSKAARAWNVKKVVDGFSKGKSFPGAVAALPAIGSNGAQKRNVTQSDMPNPGPRQQQQQQQQKTISLERPGQGAHIERFTPVLPPVGYRRTQEWDDISAAAIPGVRPDTPSSGAALPSSSLFVDTDLSPVRDADVIGIGATPMPFAGDYAEPGVAGVAAEAESEMAREQVRRNLQQTLRQQKRAQASDLILTQHQEEAAQLEARIQLERKRQKSMLQMKMARRKTNLTGARFEARGSSAVGDASSVGSIADDAMPTLATQSSTVVAVAPTAPTAPRKYSKIEKFAATLVQRWYRSTVIQRRCRAAAAKGSALVPDSDGTMVFSKRVVLDAFHFKETRNDDQPAPPPRDVGDNLPLPATTEATKQIQALPSRDPEQPEEKKQELKEKLKEKPLDTFEGRGARGERTPGSVVVAPVTGPDDTAVVRPSPEVADPQDNMDPPLSSPTKGPTPEDRAATKIQSRVRGMQARKLLRKQRSAETAAATKIQANYRGMRARAAVKQRRGDAAASKAVADAGDATAATASFPTVAALSTGADADSVTTPVAPSRSERTFVASKSDATISRLSAASLDPQPQKVPAEGASEAQEVPRSRGERPAFFDSDYMRMSKSARRMSVVTPDLTVSRSMIDLFENSAATKIQAGYRGMRARRRVRALKEEQCSEDDKGVLAADPGVGPPRPPPTAAPPKKTVTRASAVRTVKVNGKWVAVEGAMAESALSPYGVVDKAFVLERYRFGAKLGDGNFAEVLRCHSVETGEAYAVKIIDKSKTTGTKESKMVEHEIATMRMLDHPGCIRLHDVLETEEHLYLIEDLVEGGDLFDRIVAHGKYSEEDARLLVKSMAQAIQHMHQLNIIHRDLKPENCLVTTNADGKEVIKLADFGLSMVITEDLHTICGTPTYVAPEIIHQDSPGYGLEVDMWALGVIMYIILCEFPPFSSSDRRDNNKDLFDKIRGGNYSFPLPYWEGVSNDAKDLIDNLLKVSRTKRFTAEKVLAHRWFDRS